MADVTIARPLSGEIMVAAAYPASAGLIGKDVLDAEFELVGTGVQPDSLAGSQPARTSNVPGLRDLVPAKAPGFLSRPGGTAFWTAGLTLTAAAFWASGGHALVRPASLATLDRAADIHIANVTSRVHASGERTYLFVGGETVNDGAAAGSTPPLEISVVAADDSVTRYRLGKSSERLEAGARTAFSSRLDLPKNGVKAVTVTVAR